MAELLLLAGVVVAAAAATLVTDWLPVPREALYILVGLAAGSLVPVTDVALLAEAGGVLLVFLVTMHVRTGTVRGVLAPAVWTVAAQAVLFAAAAAAAFALGMTLLDALLIGLAGSMSSSMLGIDRVGTQVDRRLLHGRLTEAVTLGQDILAVCVVAALPFLALPVTALGAALAALLAVLLAVRAHPAVRRALTWLGRDGAVTVMVGLAVLWLVETATIDHRYGTVIGAVLAGLLLAAHPENRTLLETLEPIGDFFAALFFVVLGVLAVPLSAHALLLAAALVVVVALVRPLLTLLVLHARGVDLHASFVAAFQLDQVSEIVLLVALLHAAVSGPDAAFRAVVLAAAATFVASDITTRHADRLYPFLHGLIGRDREPVDRTGHVIVAGYGALGRAAAPLVQDPVVIDNDPDAVERAREDGCTALLGDVRDHVAWERAALDAAEAVVLTVPLDAAALDLSARDVTLVAVTETPGAAERCRELGAAHAVDDTSLTRTALHRRLDDVLEKL